LQNESVIRIGKKKRNLPDFTHKKYP